MKEHRTDDSGHMLLKLDKPNQQVLVDIIEVPEGYRIVTEEERATYRHPPRGTGCITWAHTWTDVEDGPYWIESSHYAVPVGFVWPEDKEPLECKINGKIFTAHNKAELIDQLNEATL